MGRCRLMLPGRIDHITHILDCFLQLKMIIRSIQPNLKSLQRQVQVRNIIRKYPRFADMRAAYTAALWSVGARDEAESNWVSVLDLDVRYKNIEWVKTVRRWPKDITIALEKFLTLS